MIDSVRSVLRQREFVAEIETLRRAEVVAIGDGTNVERHRK